MSDIFSKSKRSDVMRKIRSKGSNLDKTMGKILRQNKIHYRSYPKIFGNPDFLIEKNIVLFCDGSFWHGKNWNHLKIKLAKGNNPEYWLNHIKNNRKRDRIVSKMLKSTGFTVIRFWDVDIYKRPEWCVLKIREQM